MKKYMVAAFLAILVAVMIAFPPQAEQHEKIYVPYTVSMAITAIGGKLFTTQVSRTASPGICSQATSL